jgi:hypothetical protein
MDWKTRIKKVLERASETNEFSYSPEVNRMYQQFMTAFEAKDVNTLKRVTERMGF